MGKKGLEVHNFLGELKTQYQHATKQGENHWSTLVSGGFTPQLRDWPNEKEKNHKLPLPSAIVDWSVDWWVGGLVGWWVGGLVGWWVGGLVGWWVGGLVGWWVGGLIGG